MLGILIWASHAVKLEISIHWRILRVLFAAWHNLNYCRAVAVSTRKLNYVLSPSPRSVRIEFWLALVTGIRPSEFFLSAAVLSSHSPTPVAYTGLFYIITLPRVLILPRTVDRKTQDSRKLCSRERRQIRRESQKPEPLATRESTIFWLILIFLFLWYFMIWFRSGV